MNFTKDLLNKHIRADNRQLLEPSNYTITHTKYTTTLKNETSLILIYHNLYITKPQPSKPHQGIVRINSNIRKLSKFLKKVFQSVIDLDALSLVYNESCCELLFDIQVVYTDSFPMIVDCLSRTIKYIKDEFKINLFLFYEPICYYYCKNGVLLRDPNNKEQAGCEWEVFVVMNGAEIVFVEKIKGECEINDIIQLIVMSDQRQI